MDQPERTNAFLHRHLLGIADLSANDITFLLDVADSYVELNRKADKKQTRLKGQTLINLFFENSTRTRTSFELAGKRLGADVINMAVATSSIKKGETMVDTAMTLNAMRPDVLVVRHPDSGAVKLLSEKVNGAVINAGDGSHEHPTQALLDALTIKKKFKNFSGLKIAICGDILHSRVARSNIEILSTLGSSINVIGPKSLIPKNINALGVNVFHDMKKGLKNCDIVMMLRIQKERIISTYTPNEKEYFKKYGLDYKKLSFAKKKAFVMHPGPMNRGVEIDTTLADDITRSLIQEQVTMGVAIRMACLEILINNRDRYGL